MESNGKKRRTLRIAGISALIAALLISVGLNIYLAFSGYDSYLQSPDQIYIMESGILRANLDFRDGADHVFTYDFDHPDYRQIIETYAIDEVAGTGTDFARALRLMQEFSPRLRHKSDYDNHVQSNALELLAYSLDNRDQGINCRAKAQILNEMCLALGIYARKVWIMPNSGYDADCHVVNEIWDSAREKWIMLDITNNEYWVDETGTPLSVLQIRQKGAMQDFCTPVKPGDSLDDLASLKQRYIGDFLYIMKNMAYMEYTGSYTVGEGEDIYLLFPKNMDTDYESIISAASCEAAPAQ